ncbi:MAG: heme o synthase [Rickettsiales bacterium]|nr:heme o synthase [Rickettsiales bacterium]
MKSKSIEISSQFSEVKDYISLLKPRVMSLVVFTGLCGMLIAPGEINPLIAFIAIFCITIGSGASGAINMWYERETDKLMKRTQNRPLPQGRINPANALDFAGIIAFFSVFLMAFAVNILSAFLLLSAILFYVFIYTIWLKPSTPQNIVIGGAAGAFPPMIGWAAVTGDLTIMPIILFLIIFLWTPPHFWALAIYKNEDYQKANIPMMPVIYGVDETKKQMLLYTIVLFAVTLIPFFYGFSGNLYLASAVILGLKFLHHSIIVFKNPEEKNCRKMFGFSILYLFLLFTFLVLDKFI